MMLPASFQAMGPRKEQSKSTRYRNKIQITDPEKYQEYLRKQRDRNRALREKKRKELRVSNPSEAVLKKHDHEKELHRIRQRRYMQKREREGRTPSNPKKIRSLTRSQLKQKREYDRERKQKQRASMSYQQKTWERKRDRERKAAKRLTKNAKKLTSETVLTSPQTLYNTTSRVKSALPKDANAYAEVLTRIMKKCSPKKRKALQMKGMSPKRRRILPEETVDALKQSTCGKKALKKIAGSLKGKSDRAIAQNLKINRRTVCSVRKPKMRRKRKYKVNKSHIKDYYKREDVSRIVPQKRYATKDGPGYLMQVSIRAAWNIYKAEFPQNKCSLGTFAKVRPRNVRKLTRSHREYCCCVYCMNVRYKLLALKKATKDGSKKKSHESDLLQIILCPKSDESRFYKRECIDGTCNTCGATKLEAVKDHYQDISPTEQFHWGHWEKLNNVVGSNKKILRIKTGTRDEMLQELIEQDVKRPSKGTTFPQHLHTALWQQRQFNIMKENLPEKSLLRVMDFAKNREVRYQTEIKAAFYTTEQITLHPVVNYYRSPRSGDIVKHSVVIISDDKVHDYHAVEKFQQVVDAHLHREAGLEPEEKIIWSDGCASQYKSKGPFADIALNSAKINRNYFGSEHGKGDGDAEIGQINRAVDRAIIGNQVVINDAQDMHKYCEEHLTIVEELNKREFLYVSDVPRDRPETNVKTLKTTRKLHQILNTSDRQYSVHVRNLTCFCKKCRINKMELCLNKEYVSPYSEKHLQLASSDQAAGMCAEDFVHKTAKSTFPATFPDHSDLSIDVDKVGECHLLPYIMDRDRENYFSEKLKYMQKSVDFEDLQAKCLSLELEMDLLYPNVIPLEDISMALNDLALDDVSAKLLPGDLPTAYDNFQPAAVYGDGNCLPRTGSIHTFGHEDGHKEIRLRIVVEMCKAEENYLNSTFLNKGVTLPKMEAEHLVTTYTMMSPFYTPGDKITPNVSQRLYRSETLDIVQNGAFMGIWQLFALSSVLGCRIRCVYPDVGPGVPRIVLNRVIHPRVTLLEKEIAIMWTSTRHSETSLWWEPNHFVPLVQETPDLSSSGFGLFDVMSPAAFEAILTDRYVRH